VTVTPSPMPAPISQGGPTIVLQRLRVSYNGQDGSKVIGSGCPGTDGKGSIVDYHFVVAGVNPGKQVVRVVVAGDTSTATWEWPCNNDWALLAKNMGEGVWDVFVAPSVAIKAYTLLFFYADNSLALGTVVLR
jgi:hypothetical protein